MYGARVPLVWGMTDAHYGRTPNIFRHFLTQSLFGRFGNYVLKHHFLYWKNGGSSFAMLLPKIVANILKILEKSMTSTEGENCMRTTERQIVSFPLQNGHIASQY